MKMRIKMNVNELIDKAEKLGGAPTAIALAVFGLVVAVSDSDKIAWGLGSALVTFVLVLLLEKITKLEHRVENCEDRHDQAIDRNSKLIDTNTDLVRRVAYLEGATGHKYVNGYKKEKD